MHTKQLFSILIAILITCISTRIAFSQDVSFYFIKENIGTLTSNTELIISDQLNLSCTNQAIAAERIEESKNIFIDVESSITPTSKFLVIPLGYTFKKKYSISCVIPFYLSRGLNYSHGTESSSGIGDLTIKASFKHRKGNFRNEYGLAAKLPTGDAYNQVNGYIVPLGTGTTDFIGQAIINYKVNKSTFYGNMSFRINGKLKRKATIDLINDTQEIDYSIKNGNTFMFYTSYSYKFWKYTSILAGLSAIKNGKGEIDQTTNLSSGPSFTITGNTAGQNFFIFDGNPALVFSIKKFNLLLGCKIPLYTKVSELNSEEKRKLMYTFSLSYSIH